MRNIYKIAILTAVILVSTGIAAAEQKGWYSFLQKHGWYSSQGSGSSSSSGSSSDSFVQTNMQPATNTTTNTTTGTSTNTTVQPGKSDWFK